MGADHARTLVSQVPGTVLQVVCDTNAALAAKLGEETGARDSASDPVAAIRRPDVDAVLIASPDATHASLTLAAIDVGKPVLCEKPLAPTSAECLAVVTAEERAGRRLVQVGFMRRFDPAYAEMKKLLKSGKLGRPLMFHCFHRNVSAPAFFDAGMAITNSAPHEFDIARWLLDTEFAAISVFRPEAVNPDTPGSPVFMVVNTRTGELVTIEVNNNAAYGYDVRGELVGEKGSVSLRSAAACAIDAGLAESRPYPSDWRPRFADAYRLELQAWIGSIRTAKPAGASAWDGYAATAIAEAGVASLTEKRAIPIDLPEPPSIYRTGGGEAPSAETEARRFGSS
jgi:myo-inositol 2-dehydrogenase/D-chiro-inositol 1-dehydrogenase